MAIDVVHSQAPGQCLPQGGRLAHGGAEQARAAPFPDIAALNAACPALL